MMTDTLTVGRFRIEGRLRKEGPGKLYRGFTDVGKPVLVSVIPASMAQNAVAVANYGLRPVDLGSLESGEIFFAYEMPSGELLSKRLERGPLSWGEAVIAFVPVLKTLAGFHARGEAYGEISPASMILGRDGTVAPIGRELKHLSRAFDRRRADTWPEPEVVPYLSPERTRGGAASAASDVFALSAVIFEAITGRRAFIKPNILDLLEEIRTSEVPALTAHDASVPKLLSEFVARGLDKEASRRPSSSEMEDALRRLTVPAAKQDMEPTLVDPIPPQHPNTVVDRPQPQSNVAARFEAEAAEMSRQAETQLPLAPPVPEEPAQFADAPNEVPVSTESIAQASGPEPVYSVGDEDVISEESSDPGAQPVAAEPAASSSVEDAIAAKLAEPELVAPVEQSVQAEPNVRPAPLILTPEPETLFLAPNEPRRPMWMIALPIAGVAAIVTFVVLVSHRHKAEADVDETAATSEVSSPSAQSTAPTATPPAPEGAPASPSAATEANIAEPAAPAAFSMPAFRAKHEHAKKVHVAMKTEPRPTHVAPEPKPVPPSPSPSRSLERAPVSHAAPVAVPAPDTRRPIGASHKAEPVVAKVAARRSAADAAFDSAEEPPPDHVIKTAAPAPSAEPSRSRIIQRHAEEPAVETKAAPTPAAEPSRSRVIQRHAEEPVVEAKEEPAPAPPPKPAKRETAKEPELHGEAAADALLGFPTEAPPPKKAAPAAKKAEASSEPKEHAAPIIQRKSIHDTDDTLPSDDASDAAPASDSSHRRPLGAKPSSD
jgi:hypothetical protein